MFLVPNWCSHCKQQETKLDFSVKCMVLVIAPIKLIWKWRHAALSHTVCKFEKKFEWIEIPLSGLRLASRGHFYRFHDNGKHTWPQRLTSDRHRAVFWGSYFLYFFCFFFEFFCLCLEKVLWFYSLFSSKFFDQFWCPFSRSDCHTPTNYLRSHLGLRSTKILLWAVTLQI